MIKPIYSCAAAIMAILAGAVFFRPHILRAVPSSATATRSGVLQEPTPEQKIHLAKNYGKLPLSVEANKGQTDGRVKFLSRGHGYGLFLTSSEAVLTLRQDKSKDQEFKGQMNHSRLRGLDTESQGLSVLRLKLLGANPTIDVTGLEELPGKSNYFVGNDPKAWRTDVPTFAQVQYKDVYPGVDLIYYGHQGQLEHDWVVAPGADLSAIRFSVGGAYQIRIVCQGDLVIQTGAGEVRFRKPVVYQQEVTIDSPQPTAKNENRNSRFETRNSSLITRQLLDGRYVLRGKGGVGFEVASYDRRKPLIIDPVRCKHIKAQGGKTFAQDMSAEVDGMPLSAQASGCIDFVLPPGKIPAELQGLVRTVATKKKRDFDPKSFLATIGEGRRIVLVPGKQTIFAQGDAADTVFYIQKGKVRLTVLSEKGKEATIRGRGGCAVDPVDGQLHETHARVEGGLVLATPSLIKSTCTCGNPDFGVLVTELRSCNAGRFSEK